MNLVIDAGNSFIKFGIFQHSTLIIKKIDVKKNFLQTIATLLVQYPGVTQAIISSVAQIPKDTLTTLKKTIPVFVLDHHAKIPFQNTYTTPLTLGIDRIALTSAAVINYPQQHVLVIDAGTCITYDFKTKDEIYLGGAIAPGITLRYKSLHTHTANLPLLYPKNAKNITGKNTHDAIHSGVIYGVQHEIDGIISTYCNTYPDLTVILTGGDAHFLSKRLKNTIFANSDFLLEGLNYLLAFNISQ